MTEPHEDIHTLGAWKRLEIGRPFVNYSAQSGKPPFYNAMSENKYNFHTRRSL